MLFNIIYTAGTVKALIPLVSSLLEFSDFQFRLVANGCDIAERKLLSDFCNTDDRLNYYWFPSYQVAEHGRVLDHLLVLDADPFFCFMDSDIFLTQPIENLEEIIREGSLSALFSALPIWVKEEHTFFKIGFNRMMGPYNRTADGLTIGSSYFNIYNRAQLQSCVQQWGLSFESATKSELPSEIQFYLARANFHQTFFDTGKIINIFLALQQYNTVNFISESIQHIGGFSLSKAGKFGNHPTHEVSNKKSLLQNRKNLKMYLDCSNEERRVFSEQLIRRQHVTNLFSGVNDQLCQDRRLISMKTAYEKLIYKQNSPT